MSSGEPLPYHYFVNIHLAAISQVTRLDLPLVFLRLFILPLIVLLVLLLSWRVRACRQVRSESSRPGWSSSSASCSSTRSETVLVSRSRSSGSFFPSFLSPSYLFGLVFFVPLMTLIGERLRAIPGGRPARATGHSVLLFWSAPPTRR